MGRTGRLVTASLAALACATALGACSRIPAHRGYIVDPLLVDSIAPGVDNRASVERTLGRPTFTGQFNENQWYYVSRDTRQLAFNAPRAHEQTVLRVTFDPAGNVSNVERTGVELAKNISPNGDQTPTRGRDRSFFEELFGNIGGAGPATEEGSGGG